MTSLKYNKINRADEIEAEIVPSFFNPKYTAWTYFIPPISGGDTVLFLETDVEDAFFTIAPLVEHTIVLCLNFIIATGIQSQIAKTKYKNKFLILVASVNHLPFKEKSFDFIIARNFYILWRGNKKREKELIDILLTILSESGTALIGCKDKSVNGFLDYVNNFLRSCVTGESTFHSTIRDQVAAMQNVFFCMPDHIIFEEIIFSEWLVHRQEAPFSLRQLVKKLIIIYLFPYGSPSANYILQKKKFPSLLQLIFTEFSQIFGGRHNDLKVHRILIGNPGTIICLVSIGSREFVIRIPMRHDALVRAQCQLETLCYLQSSFRGDVQLSKFPRVHQPYKVLSQVIFVEERLRGVVIESASCLNKFAVASAVNWLIDFHLSTQQVVEHKATYLHDLIDKPFDKLYFYLRTKHEQDIFLLLRERIFFEFSSLSLMTVCMHGDYKIENMVFSKNNRVIGVFDWDLSIIQGLPVIDLLYFIAYNETLKNKGRQITEIYFDKFVQCNANDYEIEFVRHYMNKFNLGMSHVMNFAIISWVYHVVFRTPAQLMRYDDWYCKNINTFLLNMSKIIIN